MAPRTSPPLSLPSLLSDLSSLSSTPSLLPSLTSSSSLPLPHSPDLSSPLSSDSSPSTLAVQVAEEFLRASEVLMARVEEGRVEELGGRIEGVESGVREVVRGLGGRGGGEEM